MGDSSFLATIGFYQVREDPRLDLEVARSLPSGARVIMIASGGETAVCLSRLPLAHLLLVDVNPAQLALTRCRMYLAETRSCEESMAWLGHTAMSQELRWEKWAGIFETLHLPEDVFAPPALVGEIGPDQCGRYEAAFSALRQQLAPVSVAIENFLHMSDAVSASRMLAPGTEVGKCLENAFSKTLSLKI